MKVRAYIVHTVLYNVHTYSVVQYSTVQYSTYILPSGLVSGLDSLSKDSGSDSENVWTRESESSPVDSLCLNIKQTEVLYKITEMGFFNIMKNKTVNVA